MTAQLLNGKALALSLQDQIREQVAQLGQRWGRVPGLAVIRVGEDPASAAYVRNKEAAAARVGMDSFGEHFSADVSMETVKESIQRLNRDPAVDGILLQLPLPQHLDSTALLGEIHPDKDVDGLHPVNLGRLLRSEPGLRSCTPLGIMTLLQAARIPIAGKKAVVVGRSILVGKPISLMLLAEDATVVMAHSRTPDLAAVTASADILVVAVGKPRMVTAPMVKPGSTVIDVGINRLTLADQRSILVGDVDFEGVKEVAGAITPVPGGVGPMTVTLLLHNTLLSFARQLGAEIPPLHLPSF